MKTPASKPSLPLNRRQFVVAGSTLAAGALAGCHTAGSRREHGIIDTHTHFYDPRRPQGVPWPSKDDPFLYRPVLPAEYISFARPLGVAGTVVVEASAWEEDNQWILDLAAHERMIVGLVGNLKPGKPGFTQQLERFSAHRLFLGIRTGLGAFATPSEGAAFVQDLKRLADRDLVLDLLVGPEALPHIDQLAKDLPTLRIVINHVANVRIDGQAPPQAWVDGMRACARHANVSCKVSALVEGTGRNKGDAPSDVEFYRPTLEVVWKAFGEDRLIYGSNWPVSARFASYAQVQQLVTTYFASKGTTASAKYFHRNAKAIYRYVS